MKNFILLTDSYKINHGDMYPEGTEYVYSYFEARNGAEFPATQLFGLQRLLKKYFKGKVITKKMIKKAKKKLCVHFGGKEFFDDKKWTELLEDHGGKLPIEIRAVAEGAVIPNSNVLFVIVNTDPKYFWLVSHVETLLTHVWFTSTIATKGHVFKKMLNKYAEKTSMVPAEFFVPFLIHDFGFRGTSSLESAESGGLAHLVNFKGTDTLPALWEGQKYYNANLETLGFSVVASEHSVATSEGEKFDRLLKFYPNGILSMVADSYNITRFVSEYIRKRRDAIIARYENGTAQLNRLVIRPDSPRFKGDTPQDQVLWIYQELDDIFGHTVNDKGYKVLHPAVGVLYGDGLADHEIEEIYKTLEENEYSIENCVVGQGGGLLQKVNRDTQRFAFKCSAQCRNGEWHTVQKNPLDQSKASKAGRMKLVWMTNDAGVMDYSTLTETHPLYHDHQDLLTPIFRNGKMLKEWTFDEIRKNGELSIH